MNREKPHQTEDLNQSFIAAQQRETIKVLRQAIKDSKAAFFIERICWIVLSAAIFFIFGGLLMVSRAHAADSEPHALKPSAIGLHVGSWHSTPGFNNANHGLYARWQARDSNLGTGLVAGAYKNSEWGHSAHIGYAWNTTPLRLSEHAALSLSATAGLVTGYERRRVLPFVLPSAHLHIGQHTRVNLSFAPKFEKRGASVAHLSVEARF